MRYALRLAKLDGEWAVSIDAKGFVPGPFTAQAAVYYVDVATGNDSNDGLSTGAKKKSIHSAITAGNATSGPYRIIVTAGTYDLANGPVSSTTNVRATQDCALIAEGGRVVCHSALTNLTWALDSGTTYSASRNQTGFVLDLDNGEAELTRVADAATVRTTPGSWTEVSNTVYVNRADGAAVTNSNTRVLLWVTSATWDHTTKSLYVENFDFQGGRYGALDCHSLTTVSTRNAVAVGCTFKYAGQSGNPAPGFYVDRMTGLALLVDCTAEKNSTDGFNFHANGTGVETYALTVNCTASDNGRYGATSCNGHTGHEAVIGIDVGGDYTTAGGATVHWIQTSKLWCLGTVSACTSSSASDAAFKVSNTSQFWLQDAEATAFDSSSNALYAQGGTIRTRNVTIVQGVETADGGGTLASF